MTKSVTVKTLDSNDHVFGLDGLSTVGELKAKIAERLSVPASKQRLILLGRVLKDDEKIEEIKLADKAIHMVERAPPQPIQSDSAGSSSGSGQRRGGTYRAEDNFFIANFTIPQAVFSQMDILPMIRRILQNMYGLQRAERIDVRQVRQQTGSGTGEQPQNSVQIQLNISQEDAMAAADGALNGLNSAEPARRRLEHVRHVLGHIEHVLYHLEHDDESSESNAQDSLSPTDEHPDRNGRTGDTGSLHLNCRALDAEVVAPDNAVPPSSGFGAPGQPSAAESVRGGSRTGENGERNRSGSGSRPHLAPVGDLADAVSEMLNINDRLRPYVEQYRDMLRSDQSFDGRVREGRRAGRLFGTMRTVLHNMAHVQHALSDLSIHFCEQPPRYLYPRLRQTTEQSTTRHRITLFFNAHSFPSAPTASAGTPNSVPRDGNRATAASAQQRPTTSEPTSNGSPAGPGPAMDAGGAMNNFVQQVMQNIGQQFQGGGNFPAGMMGGTQGQAGNFQFVVGTPTVSAPIVHTGSVPMQSGGIRFPMPPSGSRPMTHMAPGPFGFPVGMMGGGVPIAVTEETVQIPIAVTVGPDAAIRPTGGSGNSRGNTQQSTSGGSSNPAGTNAAGPRMRANVVPLGFGYVGGSEVPNLPPGFVMPSPSVRRRHPATSSRSRSSAVFVGPNPVESLPLYTVDPFLPCASRMFADSCRQEMEQARGSAGMRNRQARRSASAEPAPDSHQRSPRVRTEPRRRAADDSSVNADMDPQLQQIEDEVQRVLIGLLQTAAEGRFTGSGFGPSGPNSMGGSPSPAMDGRPVVHVTMDRVQFDGSNQSNTEPSGSEMSTSARSSNQTSRASNAAPMDLSGSARGGGTETSSDQSTAAAPQVDTQQFSRYLLGAMQRVAVGSEQTINSFMEGFSFGRESGFTSYLLEFLTFSDIIQLFNEGHYECLDRIANDLRQALSRAYFDGNENPSTADIERVAHDVSYEDEQSTQQMVAETSPVDPDVSISSSLLRCQELMYRDLLSILYGHTDIAGTVGQALYNRSIRGLRQASQLCVRVCSGGRIDFQGILERFLARSMELVEVPEAMRPQINRWLVESGVRYVMPYLDGPQVDVSEMIVRNQTNEPQETTTANVGDQKASESSADDRKDDSKDETRNSEDEKSGEEFLDAVEAMDIEAESGARAAGHAAARPPTMIAPTLPTGVGLMSPPRLGLRAGSTGALAPPIADPAPPLDDSWREVVPPEWVKIIEEDVEHQRKNPPQNPQTRLSEAYLAGMPALKRKRYLHLEATDDLSDDQQDPTQNGSQNEEAGVVGGAGGSNFLTEGPASSSLRSALHSAIDAAAVTPITGAAVLDVVDELAPDDNTPGNPLVSTYDAHRRVVLRDKAKTDKRYHPDMYPDAARL